MRTAVSARCAGACPLRRTYTREEQPPTKREEKGARFPTKETEKDKKQESIRKKVHLFLSIVTTARKKTAIYFAKTSSIRNKRFIFALEQTQLSHFPAALRCPYSAKQTNYRPHNQRTRSLTD